MSSSSAGWPAPLASGPVSGRVTAPGSKSQTSRALLLAALGGAKVDVLGAPASRDTTLMVDALRAIGVRIETGPDPQSERMTVDGSAGLRGGGTVDCGLAGTVMRFVPPMAALADGPVRFDGDPRARERPMGPVLHALRALGASIDGEAAALPFVVHGTGGVAGGEVTLDASASSQFVSGLLLSGARFDKGLVVRHRSPSGTALPSLPHISMTVDMLRGAGVEVEDSEPDSWRVSPGPVIARDWVIEPDLSNAAVYLAAAAMTGGEVTVAGWPAVTNQPGVGILDVLAEFGARATAGPDGLTVSGPDRLSGVDVDLRNVGELAPTVAALAAVAGSPSRLRGIAHLRGHETDRLAALAAEITALGGRATETDDGLAIEPSELRADPDRPWRAYADHRMATAGALLGLMVPGVVVDDIHATFKTIPNFPALWAALVSGS